MLRVLLTRPWSILTIAGAVFFYIANRTVDAAIELFEPTPTITPTFTPTPTPTATPTQVPTPTPTFTPTPDIPASFTTDCIPRDTLREYAEVQRVVDGDTIDVLIGSSIFRVRYIGIDTPKQGEYFYSEAGEQNERLLGLGQVVLVKDVSERDQFDRLLRYVIAGDSFVNYQLVRQGFAYASSYPPDVACSEVFAQAQSQAAAEPDGFWRPTSTPAPTRTARPTPTITRRPTATTAPEGTGGGNCHPSYPDVCIPPPPPDLDCGDIPYRRFRVVGSDPHRFDGDNDGIGCESG